MQYTLARIARAIQINFAHGGSLSMASEIQFIEGSSQKQAHPSAFFIEVGLSDDTLAADE